MDRFSTASTISALVAIAVIATISAPADPNLRAETVAVSERVMDNSTKETPFVVAQGRCINGRCY
jgi:hypothetical protein